MLTKKFGEQTIAAAIIYAARKASKVMEKDWNCEAFSHIIGKALDRTEVESCFDILYKAYDGNHSTKTTGPYKIEINFTQVDSSERGTDPKLVEIEQAPQDKKPKSDEQSGEQVSTRGCEQINSENSVVDVFRATSNKEDYSSNIVDSSSLSHEQEGSSKGQSSLKTLIRASNPSSQAKSKNASKTCLSSENSSPKTMSRLKCMIKPGKSSEKTNF
jgi:hypothetical protein